jgi:hypothetical protein
MWGIVGARRRPSAAATTARQHAWAALLLALAVFGYLWPVLVGGKILSPIADLYSQMPWQPYAPRDVGQYTNPVLWDLPSVLYPWRFLARQLIDEGTFPAWNPYALTGIPLYNDAATGIFSLFNVPLWVLPLTYGLGVSAALKLTAGAWGTYLLVRQLRLGFLPGLLAGIAFAFSAFNIVWLAHETLPGVAVMLPWALWLVERIFERGSAGSVLGLALATAVALGGGHPGMQVHFVAIVALYALLRAGWSWGPARTLDSVGRVRGLAFVGAGVLAGALLMAFMLVPEAHSTHGTVGVLARKSGSLPGQHMPLGAIQTVLFPDRWGRPSSIEIAGPINYNERTFYVGAVAFLMACVGLLAPGGWRRKAPFALLAAIGLGVGVRAPVLYWLAAHLPVLDLVEAERLQVAFQFAVPVLAAFGLQALVDRPAWDRRRLLVLLLALLAVVLELASAGIRGGDLGRTARHFLSGTNFARPGVLALTSVIWFVLFATGVAVALAIVAKRPGWRVTVAAVLVALAVADAYHFAHGYQPMGPPSKVIPPVTPAVAYLERHRSDGRVLGVGGVFPNDWGLVYGLEDVRGYDPPQPTTRMLALWRVTAPEQISWAPLEVPVLNSRSLRVLGVLGARYVVMSPGVRLPRARRRPLRLVYAGPDASIARIARTAPRAFVAARVRPASGQAGVRRRIAEPRFDPQTTVAVEREQSGAAELARLHPGARGSVEIVRRRDARVTLRARLARRGLVVLDEQMMDGWRVRVDGRPAPALYVDDVMRGVVVPAGRHEVVWSYAVPGLRLGVLVSLLTLAALATGAIALGVRSRWRGLARLRPRAPARRTAPARRA